jgi:hypothetical protein
MRAVLKRIAATPSRQAREFAGAYFPGSDGNHRAAEAVHTALERLSGSSIGDLNPDQTVEEVLGRRVLDAKDSLDEIEQTLALEEECGPSPEGEAHVASDAPGAIVLRALLGPSAHRSTWMGATIWVRAIRGVINERARCEA